MNKKPVIFDVGSNKGDWSAIFAGNAELHLFEPNIILLHYSQVRFCYFDNIYYNDIALFSSIGDRDFFYFTNHNNGLSSVYRNQHWINLGLPMKEGKCTTLTLDSFGFEYIDFLKIDVEGADIDVLIGATKMLSDRRIRFIQIEYSDHIILSGHSFDDARKLVEQFGYAIWHFNGEYFEKVDKDYKDYAAENFYIMDTNFTQDWNTEFKKNVNGIGPFEFALEIGCFEGLTSCYICDNMLRSGGRIICVDPLTDEYLPGHEDNALFVGQYERFVYNTRGRPIELLRMKSDEAFAQKGFKDYRFDFIYIDGDHRRDQVYKDGCHAFEVCRLGGYILFDDYMWRDETRDGIDQFLKEHHGLYDLVHRDYQVMIKKIC